MLIGPCFIPEEKTSKATFQPSGRDFNREPWTAGARKITHRSRLIPHLGSMPAVMASLYPESIHNSRNDCRIGINALLCSGRGGRRWAARSRWLWPLASRIPRRCASRSSVAGACGAAGCLGQSVTADGRLSQVRSALSMAKQCLRKAVRSRPEFDRIAFDNTAIKKSERPRIDETFFTFVRPAIECIPVDQRSTA